jgi:hypothetical protein
MSFILASLEHEKSLPLQVGETLMDSIHCGDPVEISALNFIRTGKRAQ